MNWIHFPAFLLTIPPRLHGFSWEDVSEDTTSELITLYTSALAQMS